MKVIYVLCAVLFASCASKPTQKLAPDDPNFAPVPVSGFQPPPNQTGSIYSDSSSVQLFGDKNARRVGDIITVMLDERTTSKKSSKSSTKKTSTSALNAPVIAGANIAPLSANIDNTSSFSGQGGADQSNSLSGSITVTISEVLSNGVLKVRGEKWITLNNGDEYIRLSGLLRPEDIAVDNSVSSQKLADARITYSGTGDLANSNKKVGFLNF